LRGERKLTTTDRDTPITTRLRGAGEPTSLSRLPRLAVAVGMSLLLWLYVSSISDPTRPQTSTIHPNVPVTVRNIAQNLLIVGDLPTVEIQISNIGRTGPASEAVTPEAFVDLENIGPGNTSVPVRIENLENVGTVIVQPPRVTVRIEEAQRASFRVKTRIIAADTQSINPADLRLSTDRVTVRGPRRSLNRIVEVRANVDMATLAPDVSQSVTLLATDRAGKEVDGVAIEPAEVSVRMAPPATSTPPP